MGNEEFTMRNDRRVIHGTLEGGGRPLRWILAVILWALAGSALAATFEHRDFESIPIQAGGRVKPLDTFARESARFITGQERWGRPRALETLLDWMARPESDQEPFVRVDHPRLRERLGVPPDQRRLSPEALLKNDVFLSLAQEALLASARGQALEEVDREALQVVERLQLYRDIKTGDALRVVAVPREPNGAWLSLVDLGMFAREGPGEGIGPSTPEQTLADVSGLLRGWREGNVPLYADSARQLRERLSTIGVAPTLDKNRIALEVATNHLRLFQRVWMLFLLAALLFGFSALFETRKTYIAGWVAYLCGILVAAAGFTLRVMIGGRPPVTNMYESLVWAIFGATVFAIVFEGFHRKRVFALGGAVTGIVGFLLADVAASSLDPGIHPLEPVLRSNFWLAVHVLTITSSYAAFLLSWALAHWALWIISGNPSNRERVAQAALWIYRSVQAGVVLLAAGILLGALWANVSWGRFWGWDPKETWALIALLGYLAVLHGRLAGWLRDFGFVVGVLTAFLGIVMAWYGVNFVLGSGLHSYGSSTGGVVFVAAFIVLDALFVGGVVWRGALKKTDHE